jgi:hypothetical protein
MAYIGIQPKAGTYDKLDDIGASFNGSTTTFNLTVGAIAVNAGTATNCIIALNGALKTPDTDYTINVNQITFAVAPGNGVLFSGVVLGSVMPVGIATPNDGTITTAKLNASLLVPGSNGGTGVVNSGRTITLGGNITTGAALTTVGAFSTAGAFSTTGAFTAALGFTANTTVTFPTSGTLFSTAAAIGATNGGTGQTVYAVGDLVQANTTTTLNRLPSAVTGNALISGGSGTVSSWGKVGLTTHVSGILPSANGGTGTAFFGVSGPTALRSYALPDVSTTILTTNASITPGQGGTGLTTYTTGELLQATSTNVLGKLAAVVTGNVLISGGASTASSWGKVGLTTHVSGILPVANGGTNSAFFGIAGPTVARTYTFPDANATILTTNSAVLPTQGGTGQTTVAVGELFVGAAANTTTKLAAGTTGYYLRAAGAVSPVWAQRTVEFQMFNKGVAPASGVVMDGIAVTEACVIPINCSTSKALSRVNSTAAVTWNIRKATSANPPTLSTIGTVVWGVGAAIATFTTTGGTTQSLAVGEMIYLETSAASDATLADVAVTIFANVT